MSTPNYIMPERQEYSLFDINLKGKIVKRNSVAYKTTQDGSVLAEETIDRTDFYPYGLTESPSIGIYPVANMLVGKLTGKYRFEYPYYNYELELFCHEWNDRGQATHFVNLQINVGSTISALKYYELIEDTGTVVGVPWKSHFTRSPNAVKSDLFPHFDPDYKVFSDPEKWDRYFHVTPADWTGAKAPVESENQSWRLTAQFVSYNYIPFIDKRCYQLDQSYFKSATQFMHYLYFPIAKGVPVDRGGCVAVGNPDITSILSKALPEEEKHNYKPEYLYFSGLTANTVYNVKTWVKYLDENDVEQIIYSDAIQVPTLTALTYPRLTGSNARWLNNSGCQFNVSFSIVGDYEIEEAGVCYAQGHMPTMADAKIPVTARGFLELEIVTITGLLSGTTYKARTYVKTTNGEVRYYNLGGIGINDYWEDTPTLYEFTTLGALVTKPTVQIVSVSDKTYNSAFLRGRITNLGNSNATASGFVWNYTGTPTIADNVVNGDVDTRATQTDIFYAGLSGLQSQKNVYIRAFATNSAGTGYSEQLVIETLAAPTVSEKVSLISITGITSKAAVIRASVNANAGTERGVCMSTTNSNPTVADTKVVSGAGIGDFEVKLENLISLKLYYVRAYNTVAGVTTYSAPMSFTTLKNITLPTLAGLTFEKNSKETQLTVNFNITNDGGETPQNFVYLGNVLPTAAIPANAIEKTNGTGVKTHTFDLTGLTGNQYLAAYSKNTAGVVVSSVITIPLKAKAAAQLTATATKITKTKVQLTANVLDFGGSEASDWSIVLLENEVAFADYEDEFDEMTGAFSKTVELNEDKDYSFAFGFSTAYMDANSIPYAVSEVEFDTTAAVVQDNITVALTKNSANANIVNLAANYTGTSTSAIASVSIVGDQSKAPTYPLGNTLYFPSTTAPFTKEIALPNVGLWYLRAIVTTVTGKLFLSPVMQVTVSSLYDPNTNPNVENGGEVFAPYQNGNYNGREYYFGDRRWIYNGVDGAWRLDYSYKKEAVQAVQVINPTAILRATPQEELTYDILQKLDRIPRVGEKIDGFEVASVFFSDDSDGDVFQYASYYGLLLVDFDAIELCNYARAKEIADSLSAELMPIRKFPYILSYIYDRIGYSASEELWGDSETEDEASVYYANNDTIEEAFILKTQERRAIPCRILVKDRYVTNLYSRTNEVEISLATDDVNNQREVGVIERIKLTLKRKSDNAVVSSIESNVHFNDKICISYTELTPSPVKIEYVVKCALYRNPMSPITHRVWVDEVNIYGTTGVISENDFELRLNTL